MADFIDGIGAYRAFIADRVLTVARDQRSNTAANVDQDTVTFSAAAQAILNLQSRVIPISTQLTAVSGVDEGSPGNLVAVDLSGQDFRGGDLAGIVFNFADLSGANFTGASLRDASLARTNLSGAVFFGADLRGANLSGASGLTPDQLLGAHVDATTILPIGVILE